MSMLSAYSGNRLTTIYSIIIGELQVRKKDQTDEDYKTLCRENQILKKAVVIQNKRIAVLKLLNSLNYIGLGLSTKRQ
jgi:hypothetical protein